MQATTQERPISDPVDAAPDLGSSFTGALRASVHELSALVHDHLRLAALEAQSALRNLVMMIALGIAAALLAVTGWLALVATAVAVAVGYGVSWAASFFVAAIVTAALALAAALWIKHLGSRLMFVLTLGWLRPTQSPTPEPRTAASTR